MTQPLSEITQQFLAEAEFDADIGGWLLDTQTEELWWSRRIYEIFGISPSSSVSVEFALSFFSPESRRELTAAIENARKGTSFHTELDFTDMQQRYKRVVATGRPIVTAEGHIGAIRGSFQNITDSYFERERTNLALTAADIGVWEYRHDRGLLYCNDEMVRMFPLLRETKPSLDGWLGCMAEEDSLMLRQQLTQPVANMSLFEFQLNVLSHNDETTRLVRCIGRHYSSTANQIVRTVGVTLDITALQIAQQNELLKTTQDIQNSKFIALGEMAANIGHEINNPLAIIKGNLDILQARLTADQRNAVNVPIENIQGCLDRMQNITNGLRRLVRDDALEEYQPVDISEVLKITVSLLREIYHKYGISLTLHCHKSFWVSGHFSELQQVFLNLLSNARDALEQATVRDISISVTQQGNSVVIAVKDTGIGIKDVVQTRIFDALYTQKPAGKGTGLGLSLCRRIITEHQGSIQVYSSFGEGATFTVRLPSIMPPSASPHVVVDDLSSPLSLPKTATVMVVDDEPLLLEVISAYISALDWETLCCDTYSAALRMASQHHLDVILTDLNLPGVEGNEFLRALKEKKPSVPIILMTGSVLEKHHIAMQDTLVSARLYKPFSETDLIQALRTVLHAK